MEIKLVDSKLILHVFDGHDDFEAYCTHHGLKKSNMNELLADGCGVREDVDSSFRYGHATLSKLRWIKSDSETYIPVISYDHAIQTLKDLAPVADGASPIHSIRPTCPPLTMARSTVACADSTCAMWIVPCNMLRSR